MTNETTKPVVTQAALLAVCSADGCNRREPCGPGCRDNGNFDEPRQRAERIANRMGATFEPKIEVIQADRDAAHALTKELIRQIQQGGKPETDPVFLAFAKHRLASHSSPDEPVAALVEALERISGLTMSMFATTGDMACEAKRIACDALRTTGAQ